MLMKLRTSLSAVLFAVYFARLCEGVPALIGHSAGWRPSTTK
jgi:hypothetical protein